MITGIHHVSMKCSREQFSEVNKFYTEVLGLKVKRIWDGGAMYDTGTGVIEIMTDLETQLPQGVIRHFALAADHVDEMAEKIAAAGYKVFNGPKDIQIKSDPPLPARIIFCVGPMGEEIELFDEK